MHLKQENQNSIDTRTYYIVCDPFLLEKNCTSTVIFDLAEKWLFQKESITIYTDKTQAMFEASQFTSVPSKYDENKHILEKPVLCIPLENLVDLPKKNNHMFFTKEEIIVIDSYRINAAKFKNCPSTTWTILFDSQELSHPSLNQNTYVENKAGL